MSNVDINVDRRTDGLTDGRTDGRTENRTPISHPATSRCDNKPINRYFFLLCVNPGPLIDLLIVGVGGKWGICPGFIRSRKFYLRKFYLSIFKRQWGDEAYL